MGTLSAVVAIVVMVGEATMATVSQEYVPSYEDLAGNRDFLTFLSILIYSTPVNFAIGAVFGSVGGFLAELTRRKSY